MYRAVLLDVYGTLVHDDDACVAEVASLVADLAGSIRPSSRESGPRASGPWHGITVDSVVTSEDARAYKPRNEPFRLALQRLGLAATDVVHVGDSPASDIAGASELGIDTAFLSRDGRRLPAHLAATHTIDTLTALLPILGHQAGAHPGRR